MSYPPPGQGYPYGAPPNPYATAPPYGSSSAPSAPYDPPKSDDRGSGYGGAPPSYGSPYGAPPPGDKPPKEGKDKYGSGSGSGSGGGGGGGYYGAPPPTYGAPPSAPYGGSAPPYGGGPYGAPPPQGGPYGAPPPQPGAYGAPPPAGYGMTPFSSLLPSQFAPGTDPNVIACFQAADRYELSRFKISKVQRSNLVCICIPLSGVCIFW
jgi:calcium-binding protein CML